MEFNCFLFLQMLLIFIHLSLCQEMVEITTEPGKSVDLECKAVENETVTAVKLTREDLDPVYVLVYRNDKVDEQNQNPLYKGRTELHTISSNGKVSLTLHNVTESDTGVYVCRVKCEINRIKKHTVRKRATSHSTIYLKVAPSTFPSGNNNEEDTIGNMRGHVTAVFAVISVLLIAGVAVIRWVNKNRMPFRQDEATTLSEHLTESC